jgi:hypothetical protein
MSLDDGPLEGRAAELLLDQPSAPADRVADALAM